MIVIDDFIQDQVFLDIISTDETFFGPNGNFMWWNGWWNNEPITKKQHLIKNIWASNSVPGISNLVGFEYWTGIYGPDQANKDLGPHYDKDELHWARTGGQEGGEIIRPVIGTVYYPKPMGIDGGYLEIFSKGEDNEPERIQPVYNRLVIFDAGNHKHRVTEVTRGIRYAIAINLWQTELLAAKEGSMTIEEHNW